MSSTYKPGNVPPQYDPQFLARELASIKKGLEDAAPHQRLTVRHSEPEKVHAGMQVHADGVNWDPGDGEGIYVRDATNTIWLPVMYAQLLVITTEARAYITDETGAPIRIESVYA